MANLLLSVMGAFAEFERALIRERQREGITLAQARGAYRGRKHSLTPTQAQHLRARVAAGENKAALARELGMSRQTVYQYLHVTPDPTANTAAPISGPPEVPRTFRTRDPLGL